MRFLINKKDQSEEDAVKLLLQPRDRIAVDVETISLDNRLPLGIAVAISGDVGYYFFNVRDSLLHRVIDNTPVILFQGASFDIPILQRLHYMINSYEDTMLLAYASGILELSLEALSASILFRDCPSVTSQWKKKDQGNIGIDHVKMGGMSIIHACNTYALWDMITKTPLYYEIDKPCIDLVMEMERHGLLVDQYRLTEVEQATIEQTSKMEVEIKIELGDINLASNVQMAKALRDKGIIGTRKTKSGADAVSEESLRPLNHPLTNKVLKHRSLMKTLTTYVPAFRDTDEGGRIHTRFGNTNTGRWNSSKPNLQNLTRDEKFEGLEDA